MSISVPQHYRASFTVTLNTVTIGQAEPDKVQDLPQWLVSALMTIPNTDLSPLIFERPAYFHTVQALLQFNNQLELVRLPPTSS